MSAHKKLGCHAKAHSGQQPGRHGPEQTFLRESALHKPLQALTGISQEHLGPGKEEHILVLAKVQGLGQSIPPRMDYGGALGMMLQT